MERKGERQTEREMEVH